MAKLEITIDVIVHATEDTSRFFEAFNEMFELKEEEFSISNVTGHFENPITILRIKISKKSTKQFMEKFLGILSKIQIKEIIQGVEERTEKSTLHVRLDKQEFVQGKISFTEKEAIKLKIHTPIYNKKETVKIFSEIFQKVN
jgi:RNA binding exosome subunit